MAIGGEPVAAREDLGTALYSVPLGTSLELEVRREGDDAPRRVELVGQEPPDGLGLRLLRESVGIEIGRSEQDGGSAAGALVITRVQPGSPAAERGLRPGDAVLAANGQRAAGADALDVVAGEVVRSFDRGSLHLVIGRGRAAYNLGFEL